MLRCTILVKSEQEALLPPLDEINGPDGSQPEAAQRRRVKKNDAAV
jgi:hypothetical protein